MPRNARPMHVFPIALREAEVVAVTDVTPSLRRITLAGPELRGGVRDGNEREQFRSLGFDDHVKLVVPDADGTRPFAGHQGSGSVAWAEGALALSRDYTVRAWDPQTADRFEIEVVRHDGGRAAEWAFGVRVGDRIDFAGPKMCQEVAPGIDFHLLMGDETALPAIARWLDEAPAGTRGLAIIEVPRADDVQHGLRGPDGVEVRWLVRGESVRPGWSTALYDALLGIERPEGRVFGWCAGEAMTVAPIRRHLRTQWGLPKEDVDVVGYWRRTETAPDAEAEEAAPAAVDLAIELHEMGELLPPVVLRVAATLDIAALVNAGTDTADALAAATGVPRSRLELLLAAMASLRLLTIEDGRCANTSLGELLTDEHHVEDLSLDNPLNRAALALVDLLDVLRTGAPSPLATLPDDAATAAAREDRAEDKLEYLADALAGHDGLKDAASVTVVGHGAAIVTAALLTARPGVRVSLVTPLGRVSQVPARLANHGVGADAMARVSVVGQDPTAPLPAADVVVGLYLADGVDDEALAALTRATTAAARSRVLLVADLADDIATDDHAADQVLTSLVTTGNALRTGAQLVEVFAAAGCPDASAGNLGWGFGSSLVDVPVAPDQA